MSEIVLTYDLKPDHYVDAVLASESLIAYVNLVRVAAGAIDGDDRVRVELLGRQDGSLKQFLRIVDEQVGLIRAGGGEYPNLKRLALGLTAGLMYAALPIVVERSFKDDVQTVALSAADRRILADMTAALEGSREVARASREFYQRVERDRAVTALSVEDTRYGIPLVRVDRSEFPFRSGLFAAEEAAATEEYRRARYDVILMQAPFYNSARNWAFKRDGIKFSARMDDLNFLQGIQDGSLGITLQEGVKLYVEVEWKERFIDERWEYVTDSRKIKRVLSSSAG